MLCSATRCIFCCWKIGFVKKHSSIELLVNSCLPRISEIWWQAWDNRIAEWWGCTPLSKKCHKNQNQKEKHGNWQNMFVVCCGNTIFGHDLHTSSQRIQAPDPLYWLRDTIVQLKIGFSWTRKSKYSVTC